MRGIGDGDTVLRHQRGCDRQEGKEKQPAAQNQLRSGSAGMIRVE
jgi:hypothetical protein